MIGPGENGVGFVRPDDGNLLVAARRAADPDDLHVERAEQFDDPARDCAEAVDDRSLAVEEETPAAAGFVVEPFARAALVIERARQFPREREDHREQMLGAGFVEDAARVRERDAALAESFRADRRGHSCGSPRS